MLKSNFGPCPSVPAATSEEKPLPTCFQRVLQVLDTLHPKATTHCSRFSKATNSRAAEPELHRTSPPHVDVQLVSLTSEEKDTKSWENWILAGENSVDVSPETDHGIATLALRFLVKLWWAVAVSSSVKICLNRNNTPPTQTKL